MIKMVIYFSDGIAALKMILPVLYPSYPPIPWSNDTFASLINNQSSSKLTDITLNIMEKVSLAKCGPAK